MYKPPASSNFKNFVKTLSEQEFRELVVIPLLEAMKYKRVQFTHGQLEHGKDIIFQSESPLDGTFYCAAVLKVGKLDGSVSTSNSIRNITMQVEQCLDTPLDLINGESHNIRSIYIITNNVITPHAIQSIFGKIKTHRNAIQFIGIEELLDLVREYIPSLYSSPRTNLSSYLDTLFENNYFVKNLNIMGCLRKVPLHRCYTGGTVEYIEDNLLTRTQGVTITEVLEKYPFILVCGGPGSGKSTLIQRIILNIISETDVRPKKELKLLPLVLQLRYLKLNDVKNTKQFIEFIEKNTPNLIPFTISFKDIDSTAILLDGVDEIIDISIKNNLLEIIPELKNMKIAKKNISGCIVTSRTYATSKIDGYKTVFLRPFGLPEITHFAYRWFENDINLAQKFIDLVTCRKDIAILASSPLITTMMAATFESNVSEIFGNQTSIYERAVKLLVSQWDISKEINTPLKEDEALNFLMYLSNSLFTSNIQFANEDIVQEIYKKLVEEGSATSIPKTLIDVSKSFQRTGLLYINEKGYLDFLHKSIKEFFAARYIFYFKQEESLIKNANKEEWWNVVRFYFGILRRLDRASKTLVESVKRNPYLTLECIIEADRTPSQIRQDIIHSIVFKFANGKIIFNDESIPLIHLIGEHILLHIEELLSPGRNIQKTFYIAINDMLCQRNEHLSRVYIRRLYKILDIKYLEENQLSVVAYSYLTGRNSMTAKLLEDIYYETESLQIATYLTKHFFPMSTNAPKKELVESMRFDIEIFEIIQTAEKNSSNAHQELKTVTKEIEIEKARLRSVDEKDIAGITSIQKALETAEEREKMAKKSVGNAKIKEIEAVTIISTIICRQRSSSVGTLIGIRYLCKKKYDFEKLKMLTDLIAKKINNYILQKAFDVVMEYISSEINSYSRMITYIKKIMKNSTYLSRDEFLVKLPDLNEFLDRHFGKIEKINLETVYKLTLNVKNSYRDFNIKINSLKKQAEKKTRNKM